MSQATAARSVSGFFAPSPHERLERVASSLVEQALGAYRDAANARARGDEAGAAALRDAGNRAWSLATGAADELANLD